jgi:protein CpxP
MNRRWLIGIVAGVGVLAAGVAFAASSVGRSPERAKQFINWRVDDALDEIDANDTQRQKVHAMKDRLFDEGMKLRDTKQDVRDGLVEQWKSEKPDATAVHALVDQMIEDVRAFAHKAADAAIELHGTLNPEQRAEILQRAEQHRGRYRR